MNWVEIYKRFCETRKKVQKHNDGQERSLHRIIPGGIWGSTDHPDNTLYLTLNERVVAYKMLVRLYPYSKPIANECKRLIRERGKKPRKIPRRPRKPWPDHVRAKMSASHRGKTFSPESRAKMSLSKRGKTQSPEHVAAKVRSRKLNNKPLSEAARHNMSIAAKNRRTTNKWSTKQA